MNSFSWLLRRAHYIGFLAFTTFFSASVSNAQTAGQVMFVGFNADGNDGLAFVTFVDLANGLNIRFTDKEWSGGAIGVGTFNAGEGNMTWNNNTGNPILAGTTIYISNTTSATPTASIGAATTTGTFNIEDTNEVVYMYLGTAATPTAFLSAIANDGFGNGSIAGTLLTQGTNAIAITGDEDLMVYTGNINCTTTITNCITAIATPANWTTQDNGADDTSNGFPDFPTDVPCNFFGVAFTPVTYYSRNTTSGGNWNSNTAWTLNSDGSGGPLATGVWPKRHDHVVIRSTHTIVVDALDDNKSCGVSPDDLNLSNVGPGLSSFTADMFYHTGDITISGTLSITGGATDMMTAGFTHVLAGGTFSLASNLVNLGYLEVDASSTLSILDDLELSGNSTTIINTSSIITDNLTINHTDATLCGTGTATLQNGGGSIVSYTNSATVSQICTTFVVNCTGVGCTGFPVTGTGSIFGNTGPGGVGKTNATSSLVLWLDGTRGVATSASAVTAWNDQSGFGNHAIPPATINRPTLNATGLNGLPTLTFDGTDDYLSIPDHASLDLTQWSFFLVSRVNLHKNYNAFFVKGNDGAENYEFLSNFQNTGDIHIPILFTTAARSGDFETAGASMSNTTFGVFQYDYNNINLNLYKNLSSIFTRAETLTPQVNALPLFIGNEAGITGRNLNGIMAEVFAFSSKVNLAQQIIINNYLAAKYNVTLSTSDLYTMDNSGNGEFDFNVAGVGQASDGTNHKDAKGPGIVRMSIQSSSSLANGEFLFWGHNSNSLTSNLVDVDNTLIKERLHRVWRASKVGDVGSVSLSFDLTGLGSPVAANLRLLIDRNGNGFADNDVTPISGATFSSNIATFSGVNLLDGDRFTLGNTSLTNPLPIELDGFRVEALEKQQVKILWSTASELNNNYFTVQRSKPGDIWNDVTTVNGAGTTSQRNNYTVVDDGPYIGMSYYRLKQTDFDGTFTYSPIRSVTVEGNDESITVHPNPTTGEFTVTTSFLMETNHLKFFDSGGRNIPIQIRNQSQNKITIDPGNIVSGVYILQISDGHSLKSVKVIRK